MVSLFAPERLFWRAAIRRLALASGSIALVALLLSCGPKARVSYPDPEESRQNSVVSATLLQHYQQWRLVPYQKGGMSANGIDCSGFVSLTYREKFGIAVPRTTDALAEIGREIDQGEARSGDLVLFKTGFFSRHAGILLDHKRFIHASTGNGVMISLLDEPYWRDHFWQLRRIVRD